MDAPARFFQPLDGKKVRCGLCPHRCVISDGAHGKCLVRENRNGTLIQAAYGKICSAAIDPIEKKPLYHFYPGSKILSIGTYGCNMACQFCQNWQISTKVTPCTLTTPEKLLKSAQNNDSIGLAYTYNEPTIWYEFVYDCAKVFRGAGLKNILVTNGMINPEPLVEIAPLIDAANIDLKGFTDEFYKEHGGMLEPVKETVRAMSAAGIHIELTNLIIPTKNDDEAIFEQMCAFIASVSENIPLHLSRYFPQYKYEISPTPNNTLTTLAKTAKKYLNYVYIGNADIQGWTDTLCPKCGELIVRRSLYDTKCFTDKNICPACSQSLPFRL